MIEYIAKNLAIELMHQSSYLSDGDLLEVNGNLAKERIEAEPAADVMQVVRCRDCKHYYFADNRIPQEQRYVCEISGEIWKPDDFCSYGERKEEYETD